uniref:Odorant receptor n=1 Tax=Ips typographus TaxID=55986 RepID=M3VK61_IPSTY
MAVYPKSEYLKVPAIYCSTIGIFPWKFMFQDNKNLQTIYRCYSIVMLAWCIGFVVTDYIQLVILLTSKTLDMQEISFNTCITLLFTCIGLRAVIVYFSPNSANLIQSIIDSEKVTYLDDAECMKLEKKHLRSVRLISHCYFIFIIFSTTSRCVYSFPKEPDIIQNGNETEIVKEHMLSIWFPFNQEKYYLTVYNIELLDSFLGTFFVAYVDIYTFNMISYPKGQLKKLQHIMKHFHNYKAKYSSETNEENDFIVFKDLVQRHKQIIQHINAFNELMEFVAIFEFVQSSAQIACGLTQSSLENLTIGSFLFVMSFLISMLVRLFLYYYAANDVTVESTKLAQCIWESNWYEESQKIKLSMLMVIIRAQKPLIFKIGGFGAMSVQSIVTILKATYSYITLAYKRT